jgi:hypothetical protein
MLSNFSFQSRSGRTFSPYEPWELGSSPLSGPPEPVELSVLQIDFALASRLKPAALVDFRRALDGMDEAEGAEMDPIPHGKTYAPIDSPLPTPPSSPEALTPTDLPADPPLPATPISTELTEPLSARKLKQREGKKARQAHKRQQQPSNPFWAKVKPALSRIWQTPQPCKVAFSISQLPGTEGGFTGKRPQLDSHDRTAPWTLQELVDCGFQVIAWDGRYVASLLVVSFFHPSSSLERLAFSLTKTAASSLCSAAAQRMTIGMV